MATHIHIKCQILLLLSTLIAIVTVNGYDFQGYNSPPVFDFKRDIFVSETESPGNRVTTVHTIDQDNDIITYSIEAAKFRDGSKYFRIDEKTGDIFVKESLKGQGGSDFYFYVKAYDGHQYAKIEVFVRVLAASSSNTRVLEAGPRNTKPASFFPFGNPAISAHKPKDTFFIVPTPKPSTTTRKPVQLPPISPLNTMNETKRMNPNSMTTDSNVTVIHEHHESKSIFANSDDKSIFKIIITLIPYISIVCFIPIVFFVIWIVYHKCNRNVPSRNAIKTFSQKIINNNKLEGIESNSFCVTRVGGGRYIDTDFNGAMFRAKKSLEMSETSVSTNKSSLSECEWEFPRHHLRFIHILGEGCFGQVWKCEALNIANTGASQVVAVKTLKENASEKEKKDLLEELEVMKMLEPHTNVVTLIGCCTERDPVFLIMEYVPLGKLQTYLRDSRADLNYGNMYGGSSKLTSRDLVSFAYQIAKGMEYLSSKGVIHRDLAARNILVDHNRVCKVADFGFAKYNHEVYERKSEGRLPIRWMAAESLTEFIFTTKSDVWSFGILMWEIVTLGWTPYPGLTATEVIKKVCDGGYRLEKPEHCKREMYNIMYYCWDRDPSQRPSFSELVCLLDNILYSENDYIELDRFPDHAYYNILKPGNSGEKL